MDNKHIMLGAINDPLPPLGSRPIAPTDLEASQQTQNSFTCAGEGPPEVKVERLVWGWRWTVGWEINSTVDLSQQPSLIRTLYRMGEVRIRIKALNLIHNDNNFIQNHWKWAGKLRERERDGESGGNFSNKHFFFSFSPLTIDCLFVRPSGILFFHCNYNNNNNSNLVHVSMRFLEHQLKASPLNALAIVSATICINGLLLRQFSRTTMKEVGGKKSFSSLSLSLLQLL